MKLNLWKKKTNYPHQKIDKNWSGISRSKLQSLYAIVTLDKILNMKTSDTEPVNLMET